jgi:small-conductance mechanosensitive channel
MTENGIFMPTRADLLPFVNALKDVSFSYGSTRLNLYTMLQGMIAIILLVWGVRFVLALLERRLVRLQNLRPSNRALIVKFTQILLYIIAFLSALQILGISLAAFSVIGGALGVGIGFGLQKISSNFISGIILLFEKSIEVDDLIELPDGTTGFVRTISGRYTRLETADARDIIIPNEDFITQRVISLTHTNRRSRIELQLQVRHDADVELALRLLIDATLKVERCVHMPAPMAHITAVNDVGIALSLYFWIDDVVEGRLEPRTQAYLTILESFRAKGIQLAVRQMVGQ